MIQLSDHFSYSRLLRYAFPSVMTVIFSAFYGITDGLFITRFVGTSAFAGLNFIMPVLIILQSLGFVFGSGGSALIGKVLGEGDRTKANQIFSLLIYTGFALGTFLAIIGFFITEPIAILMGAKDDLLKFSTQYGHWSMLGLPGIILQFEFQCLFATAGKPKLGFYTSIASGIANIALDALLIIVFKMGLPGAAIATVISQWIGAIVPLIYFSKPNSSLLLLTKTHLNSQALIKTCTNGISEFLNNVSASFISMLYNVQLLKYAAEEGITGKYAVAAFGVMMYILFGFMSGLSGFCNGTAPIISFNFGAKNHEELKSVTRKSIIIVLSASVIIYILSMIMGEYIASLFIGHNKQVMDISIKSLKIVPLTFIFAGIGFWGSSFFTALNDGLVSAILAIFRAIICQTGSILILPMMFGFAGIWHSIVVADLLSALLTIFYLVRKKKKYNY